jgi:Chromo (CHRromatin Organisation MOdifier) domain
VKLTKASKKVLKRTKGRGRPKKSQVPPKKRRKSVSETSEDATDFEGEGDEEVDGDEEYEVDRIVEVRTKKDGTREFLVKWKRWSSKYDTWEPEANLSCPDLIEKFMEKVENAKNSTTKELRTERKHTERFTLNTTEYGRRLSRRGSNKQRVKYYDAEESE